MKKALIGNCPVCDSRQTVFLSPILEIPIGSPRKCHSCLTPLQVRPERPRLKLVVDNAVFLGVLLWIFLGDIDTILYPLAMQFIWITYISDIAERAFWRPILVVAKSESDLPSEENSTGSSNAQQHLSGEQNKS
jgi:hypothetical protein